MSKAILEYDLTEDEHDFIYAVKGRDSLIVLHEIEEFVRSKMKEDRVSGKQYKSLQSILEFIYEQKYDKRLPELI